MGSLYEIGATISSEVHTDTQLNVSVGDKHFRIDLFTANFEANPRFLQEYLLHVEHSDPTYIPPPLGDADEDDFVDPLEEFYDWAMAPFASIFRKIPPLNRDRSYTLQDSLFPEHYVYTLQVAGNELVPVQHDGEPVSRLVGALLPASKAIDMSTISVYRPSDVHLQLQDSTTALPMHPRKVYIEGDGLYFFKEILPGDVSMTVTELDTYVKIQAAGFSKDVRISRLRGVVEDDQTSRIVGLLLSYIDCENGKLSCVIHAGNHSSYGKWLEQITYSLDQLHAHGIVWGDAKPDNILVDVNDDAYLIDFGGGYTNGWVDRELMGTKEGDLQGLRRIAEYFARRSE